jgi:hypothetical protein
VYTYHPNNKKLKIGGSWSRVAWPESETLPPKDAEPKGLEYSQNKNEFKK